MCAKIAAEQPDGLERQIANLQPADQKFGQPCPRQFVHPSQQFLQHAGADIIGRDPVVQYPFAGLRNVQHLGQQGVHVQHLDAFSPHQGSKDIMVLLRLLDPEHIVKQQRLGV